MLRVFRVSRVEWCSVHFDGKGKIDWVSVALDVEQVSVNGGGWK